MLRKGDERTVTGQS